MGRGGAILTPNELVLTFRGSYVCANFGENLSRNTTVRVLADGQTHTHTDANRFIICPMLYAIAMGQITVNRYTLVQSNKFGVRIVQVCVLYSRFYGT